MFIWFSKSKYCTCIQKILIWYLVVPGCWLIEAPHLSACLRIFKYGLYCQHKLTCTSHGNLWKQTEFSLTECSQNCCMPSAYIWNPKAGQLQVGTWNLAGRVDWAFWSNNQARFCSLKILYIPRNSMQCFITRHFPVWYNEKIKLFDHILKNQPNLRFIHWRKIATSAVRMTWKQYQFWKSSKILVPFLLWTFRNLHWNWKDMKIERDISS